MNTEKELDDLFGTVKKERIPLSYSKISSYDRLGPKRLVEKKEVISDGATIGSIVDDLLNDVINHTKEFDKLYYIFKASKPTATLDSLCSIIIENYDKIPSQKEIVKIIRDNNFWSNIKVAETLIGKFDTPEFWTYLEATYASKEKTVISVDDYTWGKELVDLILIHNNSKHLFNNELRCYNQVKFKYNYDKEVIIRGIIDMVQIDDEKKTVQMIDLKTGENHIAEFMTSFLKWRYYFQAELYQNAFKAICKEYNCEGYTLLPFQFLYVSRYELIPYIFIISDKWREAAREGFKTAVGWERRGIKELLEEIKWHFKTGVFDMTRQMYEAKGAILLEDSFINLK